MGYNASEIITRFEKYAGQPHGSEPGKKGRLRERFPDGSHSSLYYRRDRAGRVVEIDSYGSHFPLAVLQLTKSGKRRRWLLNGDRWGQGGFGRTNEHNDIMRIAAQAGKTPWFTVPFSAIRSAGISPDTLAPVDVQPERYTYEDRSAATLEQMPENHRKRHVWRTEDGTLIEPPQSETGREQPWPASGWDGWHVHERRLGDKGFGWYQDAIPGPAYDGPLTSEYVEVPPGADGRYHWREERHWLGASLFRARYDLSGTVTRGGVRTWASISRQAYFVTGFDYNEPFPLWFMAELPRGIRPSTVNEAIAALKPDSVRQAEADGIPVLRQGDVFVIQARASQRELLTTGGTLVGSRHVNDSHTATNVIAMPDGTLYARGIMRHRPAGRRAEHHNLELWDRRIWGRIVLNTVPRSFSNRSWSLGGAVD